MEDYLLQRKDQSRGFFLPEEVLSFSISPLVRTISMLYFERMVVVMSLYLPGRPGVEEVFFPPLLENLEIFLPKWSPDDRLTIYLSGLKSKNLRFKIGETIFQVAEKIGIDTNEIYFSLFILLGDNGIFLQSSPGKINNYINREYIQADIFKKKWEEYELLGGYFHMKEGDNRFDIFFDRERVAFTYNTWKEYYFLLKDLKFLDEEWEDCGEVTDSYLYRLDEEGRRFYFLKKNVGSLGKKCGLISYDSLKDCEAGGLIPVEMMDKLYRKGKHFQAEPPVHYYCKKQIERDNPKYQVLSASRILKGREDILTPAGTKKLRDACADEINCSVFYDPNDALFYKKKKYESLFVGEEAQKSYLLPTDLTEQEQERYYQHYLAHNSEIYPSLVKIMMLNYHPEICISVLSGNGGQLYEQEILYTQKVSEKTRLFIFYTNEGAIFGESGHGNIFFIDIHENIASYIDTASHGRTENLLEFAEIYLSKRAQLPSGQAMDIYIPSSGSAFSQPKSTAEKTQLRSSGNSGRENTWKLNLFLASGQIGRLTVKNKSGCNSNSLGIQMRGKNTMGCFIWSLIYLEKILANYDRLKKDRKSYLNLERDLTEGFFRYTKPDEVLPAFLADAKEKVFSLSASDLEEARISQEEHSRLRQIFEEI